MADASRSDRLTVRETWRRLNFEQRAAAVGALLLIVSTLGPFSFVEAGMVLIGAAVLFLLRKRAEGMVFHLPFGDGAVIAAAGAWAAFLIVVRMIDFARPLGQSLLALVCAAILLLAGLRERAVRPPDDLPEGVAEPGPAAAPPPDPEERVAPEGAQETAETQALPAKVLPPATPPGHSREQPPLWEERP